MKLDKIPDEALTPRLAAHQFGTADWAVFMLRKKGGAATFAEATEASKDASRNPTKAMSAFQEAFDAGLISCHHVNKGRRGRPRYEFALQDEKGA